MPYLEHALCKIKSISVIQKAVLTEGAGVDSRDKDGRSPLGIAAEKGYSAAVRVSSSYRNERVKPWCTCVKYLSGNLYGPP